MKLFPSIVIVALPSMGGNLSLESNVEEQNFPPMEPVPSKVVLTPLHLSTCGGQLLDVRLMESRLQKDPELIDARIAVTECDGLEYLYTPLHLAARAGHLRCMIFLLNKNSSMKQFADAKAEFGTKGLNALALTKDSSCISLLLLNGIGADYTPPAHLGSIEYPRTLYVNVACQCNNPLALAALLQYGAATLDHDFVRWQLANNNEAAIFEDVPVCIAASVGAVECLRLLLLHGADLDVAFAPDKPPLLEYCLDRVFNCCDLHFGEQILVTLRVFGAEFDAKSPCVARNREQSEQSSDYTKRVLIQKFLQLAARPLAGRYKRRLHFFKKYASLIEYKAFIEGTFFKNWDQKMADVDKWVRNREREDLTDFLLFKDLVILPDQISV